MIKKQKIEAKVIAQDGEVIKIQNFDTSRGHYTILLVRYGSDIYYIKYLEGKMKECVILK